MKRATRTLLVHSTIIAAFAILAGRLWYMQVFQVNYYRAQAASSKVRYRVVQAPRGIIYDRNGMPLVRNVPTFDVTVTPDEWPQSGQHRESALLSHLLHGTPSARRIRWLIWSARLTPTQPAVIKPNVAIQTDWAVAADHDLLPGVGATATFTRHYLQQNPWPLSHILGYVLPMNLQSYRQDGPGGPWAYQHYTELDLTGKSGVEKLYDHVLHGVNGIQAAEINAAGDQVSKWRTVQSARPGGGIRLTIDARFEEEAARDLQAGLNHIGLRHGSAVVMDPRTGNILALVSLPSFNSDIFTAPPSAWRNRKLAAISGDPGDPLFDLSISSALAPGSIYKIITASAGLMTGVVTPSTTVDDTGTLQRCAGCLIFHGWKASGLGVVDMQQAIAESSDIYFYEVAGGGPDIPGGLGYRRLRNWARLYGLGQPTGVGLPNESGGLVPSKRYLWLTQHRPWSWGDSYNMGIGQGDTEVTPLQMARMVSVIANGGKLVRPRIVAAETTPNGQHVLPAHNYALVPDVTRPHLISPWVDSLIASGMRLDVTWDYGTSWGEIDPRLQAAGKTGTAESGGKPANAWWVGYAPYNNPKIAVCVAVPEAGGEGAYVAAPIASKIMDDYFGYKTSATWVDKVVQQFAH